MFLTILLPLISLKSATFFTKFNSLGTLNIFFLIGVVFYLAITWGIHADISDVNSDAYIPMFKDSFPSLSGMMALGLFIHNAIITIIKKNRYQENNVLFSILFLPVFNDHLKNNSKFIYFLQNRDIATGFCLVSGTYLIIGIPFYLTFPIDKNCIEDVSIIIFSDYFE